MIIAHPIRRRAQDVLEPFEVGRHDADLQCSRLQAVDGLSEAAWHPQQRLELREGVAQDLVRLQAGDQDVKRAAGQA